MQNKEISILDDLDTEMRIRVLQMFSLIGDEAFINKVLNYLKTLVALPAFLITCSENSVLFNGIHNFEVYFKKVSSCSWGSQ